MKIIFTVDRYEGDKTILKTDRGDTIIWPKNKLPENTHEGASLSFLISRDPATEEEKKTLAKNILNEILDTDKK